MRPPLTLVASLILALGCGNVASAPPELGVAALTFPQPPVWRGFTSTAPRGCCAGARLKVAIDSQFVGKTASGTFLMVELEPGSHRVSGLSSEATAGSRSRPSRTAATSSKIWPRMGVITAQSGVELMDPVEGRRAIQGARMVPSAWPGEPITPTP